MTALLFSAWLLGSAHAGDRADTLAERAEERYQARRIEPARRLALRSLAIRETEEALGVLVLVQLEDLSAPVPASARSEEAQEAEAKRRVEALEASMARLESIRPNAVVLGIVRTVVGVRTEGELLAPLVPACPAEATARFDAAEAAFARHDLNQALAAYDDALAACPKQATWWTYSGDAMHGLGNLRGAIARYERALDEDACHHVAHRFIADTMLGLSDLNRTDIDKLMGHALDGVVCNPHYDAGWGTLGAVLPGTARGQDLRLRDPQGYELLVSRTVAGEGDALDRRVAAATAVLAEGAPDSPLWNILTLAQKADVLTEAIAFETLDAQIAEAYRARRLDLRTGLRAWVVATRMKTDEAKE